jgi:hypothetical protein
VHLKYKSNMSIIQTLKKYTLRAKIKLLSKLSFIYPESIFIISTMLGYKNHKNCIKESLGGLLVFKIN